MAQSSGRALDRIGAWMAARLRTQVSGYEPYTPSDPDTLCQTMQPGDILLVEGSQYISMVIKYLTTSTWSHAAIFVGPIGDRKTESGEPHVLVEVVLGEGCISVPMSKYRTFNTRICRPVGLSIEDRRRIVLFMLANLGLKYDLKNIFDMLRYFFPLPLPQSLRRRAIALGSGDPTRAICSSLIAQAFQAVRYPILPKIQRPEHDSELARRMRREIYHIRHHSLFAPRDFDLSPYFAVVKPTIERGFDYKNLVWHRIEARKNTANAPSANPPEAAAATPDAAGRPADTPTAST